MSVTKGIASDMLKSTLIVCLSFILFACAIPKTPSGYDLSQPQNSLAEASYSVSRATSDLAETAQAAHPLPPYSAPPSPASYGMGGVTSVDWSGPVEPLLQQIARAGNYRVRVLGTPPAIPILVTVYANRVMLADVLRDTGYQCGKRASIIVFPETRVIELRYAKN